MTVTGILLGLYEYVPSAEFERQGGRWLNTNVDGTSQVRSLYITCNEYDKLRRY
jgi:hypothetical protein